MKKQLTTLLLIGALALSLLSFAGCAQRKSVLTINGEPAPAGYYAFYAHWQRDYMKELLKNAGYDIGSHMDSYYSENQTVKEYIIATAKDRYLSFLAVSKQFDTLGLTLNGEKLRGTWNRKTRTITINLQEN